jgi:hypothetical protein
MPSILVDRDTKWSGIQGNVIFASMKCVLAVGYYGVLLTLKDIVFQPGTGILYWDTVTGTRSTKFIVMYFDLESFKYEHSSLGPSLCDTPAQYPSARDKEYRYLYRPYTRYRYRYSGC